MSECNVNSRELDLVRKTWKWTLKSESDSERVRRESERERRYVRAESDLSKALKIEFSQEVMGAIEGT